MNEYERYLNAHAAAQLYKNNHVKYSEKLITMFGNYLNKYLDYFNNNMYDKVVRDLDLRRLVCLFAKMKFRKDTAYNKKYFRLITEQSINFINTVKDNIPNEELINILTIAFLNCANNYKSIRPSFHNHVYNNICYRIYELMLPCFKSYREKEIDGLDFVDNEYVDYNKYINNAINKANIKDSMFIYDKYKSCNDVYSDDFFDFKWYNGITCNYPFTVLNSFERRIIKLYYVDNLTDPSIASIFGLHYLYIMRRRHIAENKLKLCFNK